MALNRRDFLKLMGGTAAAVTFPSVMLQGCKKAIQKVSERTNVIWLQGQSCSGCSVSLLNKLDPMIDTVITEYISLNFHQTLMAGTGNVAVNILEEAVKKDRKDFILIVEGSIPTKDDLYCTVGMVDGHHVGIREWVEKLGANAKAVISVGSCATFGGIPGAEIRATGDNPTGAVPVSEILKDKTIINTLVLLYMKNANGFPITSGQSSQRDGETRDACTCWDVLVWIQDVIFQHVSG